MSSHKWWTVTTTEPIPLLVWNPHKSTDETKDVFGNISIKIISKMQGELEFRFFGQGIKCGLAKLNELSKKDMYQGGPMKFIVSGRFYAPYLSLILLQMCKETVSKEGFMLKNQQEHGYE